MKFLSVCSGIEAASVAWEPLGFECIGVSEIEPFPAAVLKYHYPDVKNYGDLTQYEQWKLSNFDVLVGGTPCQSFSIAGKRGGLDDPRGRIMLSYIGLAEKHRPEWIVWENVPGVLSSNSGRDFGTFIRELDGIGYRVAWRILDAQYFGVPQRRRRVFLVGNLRDVRYSVAVLFERGCMQRDIEPLREERKDVAPTVGTGAPYSRTGNARTEVEAIVMSSDRANSEINEGYSPTIKAAQHPIVMAGGQGNAEWCEGITPALKCNHDKPIVFEGQSGRGISPNKSGMSPTLVKGQIMQCMVDRPRRIMPVECERLQGFPDGHTNIPWRGKSDSPDSLRYKALGNSMAVPVMAWIGKRLKIVDSIMHTRKVGGI